MKKKNQGLIVSFIIYAVLILLCVSIFIIYGKKDKTDTQEDDFHTTVTTDAPVKDWPPLQVDYIFELNKSGIICDLSTINRDGTVTYQLLFDEHQDSGQLILTIDDESRIIRSELCLTFFYCDELEGDGIVQQTVRDECERRMVLNRSIIERYLLATIEVFDHTVSMNNADINNLLSAVHEACEDGTSVDKKLGKLRFSLYVRDMSASHITYGLIVGKK